jgi:hypothetical protein
VFSGYAHASTFLRDTLSTWLTAIALYGGRLNVNVCSTKNRRTGLGLH